MRGDRKPEPTPGRWRRRGSSMPAANVRREGTGNPSVAAPAWHGLAVKRADSLRYSTGSEGIGGRAAWAAARLPTSRSQIASR